ncbi:leucine-rich repeat protein [Pseudoflavonifractor phocaeensis]|uniref:leucine-rich repeat protein n=1 Tax=Pseudoflavonifractor phocaeensis TaxID=1870988 RepID=UPI00210CA7BD|nr:leucine-rich repeat protein [Pseudoflavonifractor phocaeensis]MCQ4862744.1 leucine-rich repeat protein [Pseudoflavonifractor phocaeensis]
MHLLQFLRRVSPLFVLAAVLSFLPTSASATLAEGSCGPSATWSLSTQSSTSKVLALNISGTGAITSRPWLEIGESNGYKGFKVTIEEGITEIGATVFKDTGIFGLALPETLTTIGDSAFEHFNPGFEVVGLDFVFGPNVSKIGNRAFYNGTMKNYYFLSDEISCGSDVIGGHINTTYVYGMHGTELESAVKNTGNSNLYWQKLSGALSATTAWAVRLDTFDPSKPYNDIRIYGSGPVPDYNTSNRSPIPNATFISVEEGITRLGAQSLWNNTKLEELLLPSTLTSIGDFALMGDKNLKTAPLPDSVLEIGVDSFADCASLSYATLPPLLTEIPMEAFFRCTNLALESIPPGIEVIDSGAFNGVGDKMTFTIPTSVTTIDPSAFTNCTSPISYYATHAAAVAARQPSWQELMITGRAGPDITWTLDGNYHLVFSGSGDMDTTASRSPWGQDIVSIEMDDRITSIAKSAFSSCSKLTTAKLSQDLTSIGQDAFKHCTALTIEGDKLPDSLVSIGSYAFSDCSQLKLNLLPAALSSLSDGVFYGCGSWLSFVIMPDVIVGKYVFNGCTSPIRYFMTNESAVASMKDSTTTDLSEYWIPLQYGDMNLDRAVDVGDAQYAFYSYTAGSDPGRDGKLCGDVNGDGTIDLQDAQLMLLNILYGEQFPIER